MGEQDPWIVRLRNLLIDADIFAISDNFTRCCAVDHVAVAAQLPTQKVLTIEVAQAIAQEAMMKCRAGGHRVTVTVVDQANLLKAFLRDDGAMMATIEDSWRLGCVANTCDRKNVRPMRDLFGPLED